MDNKKDDDQMLQELETKLKLRQDSIAPKVTQVETRRNPYNCEERFKLISPMYDVVLNQMNVINTCLSVHSYIVIPEEDTSSIAEIPQLLADILFESSNIRRNLIEIIGAMEQLSNGIARFVKIAKNPKFREKSLVKFLHFVETPEKRLQALLGKTYELSTQKLSVLKEQFNTCMRHSGSELIPDWIDQKCQYRKELENLENEKQKKYLEYIVEYDEVDKIISKMEFYQTKLAGHEHLKKDLQAEKKMLQANRDLLEGQITRFVTSNKFAKFFLFMRDNDLDGLKPIITSI